jgi:hypothetical protein
MFHFEMKIERNFRELHRYRVTLPALSGLALAFQGGKTDKPLPGDVMKKFILFALISAVSSMSLAWSETTPQQKEYTFKFKMKSGSFEYVRSAPSYDEAYEAAAQACFKFFKGGRHVSEDTGLEIIDTCANPRSI